MIDNLLQILSKCKMFYVYTQIMKFGNRPWFQILDTQNNTDMQKFIVKAYTLQRWVKQVYQQNLNVKKQHN